MTQEQLKNLNTIVTTYGDDPQIDMCVEECAELLVALMKHRRKESTKNKLAIIDELADVSIMVEQMKIVYGYEAVEEQIEFKINRQMERLKNSENENNDKII